VFPCLVSGSARPSCQFPPASPVSPIQQYLYLGKVAFFVHPSNCSWYLPFLNVQSFPASTTMVLWFLLSPAASAWLLYQGYRYSQLGVRFPRVRTPTFPAHLPHLLLRPLIASGFVFSCQLARPHSLLCGSCSSGRSFAFGFLQTSPHDDALAFSYRLVQSTSVRVFHPLANAHAGRTKLQRLGNRWSENKVLNL
jgi:hypothetical protein